MTASPALAVQAVRRTAGLFALPERGLLRVSGSDRRRWLDGMISAAIAPLEPGGHPSGAYATLLTAKGAIVADLHVLARPDEFWLEAATAALPRVCECLKRYIVADDVRLADLGSDYSQLTLEGPAAAGLLSDASASPIDLSPECWSEIPLAGAPVVIAAFGFSGESAFRLFVQRVRLPAVMEVVRQTGRGHGLVEGSADALEILRIEAGVPIFGAELDEEVLPPEARLERAISYDKGCYVGQEIIARLHARGQVNHLLVGLRFSGDDLPAPGGALRAAGRAVGELTSVCRSPSLGAIGLGYLRRAQAEPGTLLDAGGVEARVVELPFVAVPSSPATSSPGTDRR